MAPATVDRQGVARHGDEWLDEHARAWAAAGLITPDQVSALRVYEAAHGAPVPTVRLGPVAEAAAFVGTVLALIGGGVGLGPQWGRMPITLQLGIAVAIAVVGFIAGTWLMRLGEAGAERLGGFLWVLGAAGVALAAGSLMNEVRPDSPWMAVAVGVPVAGVGGALWRNLERPLQLITLAIGMSLTVGGFAGVLGLEPWHGALPAWLLGAGLWMLTMRATVRPTVVARTIASITTIAGAFMLCDLSITFGAAVALATAAAVIVLALRWHHTVVLVVGVLGALQAVQTLVQSTFQGPVGGAAVAVFGLALVVVIVLRAGRR